MNMANKAVKLKVGKRNVKCGTFKTYEVLFRTGTVL